VKAFTKVRAKVKTEAKKTVSPTVKKAQKNTRKAKRVQKKQKKREKKRDKKQKLPPPKSMTESQVAEMVAAGVKTATVRTDTVLISVHNKHVKDIIQMSADSHKTLLAALKITCQK
jgi:hypothetical protein